jgi:hypothetical protein
VELAPGGTQQFGSAGKMTDGSTVAVIVTYSATGGTISQGGFYTAGQSPGDYHVIATGPEGKADTSSVTITGAGPTPTDPLPPPPPPSGGCDADKSDLQWYSNFEETTPPDPNGNPDFTLWNGWDLNLIGQRWGAQLVANPARECGQALRLEVRRSDSLLAGRHRAQIQVSRNGLGNGSVGVPSGSTFAGTRGSEVWFGFSVYVPSTWVFETGYAPETIFELFEGNRTPPIQMNISGDDWQIQTQTGYGSQGNSSWSAKYTNHPITRGAWTDFVFHVKYSSGSDGIFQVWINGTKVRDTPGPNVYSDGVSVIKPIWGIYKWSWNGTTSGGNSIVSSRWLLLDNVRATNGARGSYSVVAPR